MSHNLPHLSVHQSVSRTDVLGWCRGSMSHNLLHQCLSILSVSVYLSVLGLPCSLCCFHLDSEQFTGLQYHSVCGDYSKLYGI